MPEFQDDEAHDLFQVDEFPGLHFPNEPADACGVEVAAFLELGLAEGIGDEGFEFGVFEEEVEGEEEGDLRAVAGFVAGHFGEGFVGEFAFDPFVLVAAHLEMRGHAEGEFDEPVVQEREAVFEAG